MYVVIGCAGFIGSTLIDRLMDAGLAVVGIDNFSTGQKRFLRNALLNPRFRLVELDLLDLY
jgi:UDP-glucose 4-epimerase